MSTLLGPAAGISNLVAGATQGAAASTNLNSVQLPSVTGPSVMKAMSFAANAVAAFTMPNQQNGLTNSAANAISNLILPPAPTAEGLAARMLVSGVVSGVTQAMRQKSDPEVAHQERVKAEEAAKRAENDRKLAENAAQKMFLYGNASKLS